MDSLLEYKKKFLNNYQTINEWKNKDRRIHNDNEELQPVYDRSEYIKYDEMILRMKELILKLNKNIPFTLFFPLPYSVCFKIGSENAIILECFDELAQLNIVKVISCAYEICPINHTNLNMLIIDDCIYTGKHLKHIIHCVTTIRDTCPSKFCKGASLDFTVLTYGSNPIVERHISDETEKYNKVSVTFSSFFDYKLPPDVIFDIYVSKCDNLLDHDQIQEIYKNSKTVLPDNDIPFIYFDHKIHNSLINVFDIKLFNQDCYPSRLPAEIVETIYGEICQDSEADCI